MRPDGVVEARGTQDVVAALRSGGEEQCIAATERPAPGAGRGQWAVVVGAGSEVGLSLRGKACFGVGKGSGVGGGYLGLEALSKGQCQKRRCGGHAEYSSPLVA